MRPRNKYGNIKIKHNGHTFDSKVELARYCDLVIRQTAGEITNLEVHPKYDLHAPDGTKIGTFKPDNSYIENGVLVVEDVKSLPTLKEKYFRWKRKHFEAEYNQKLTIVLKTKRGGYQVSDIL